MVENTEVSEDIDTLFNSYLGASMAFYELPYIGNDVSVEFEPSVSLNWGPVFAANIGAGSFVWGGNGLALAVALTGDFRSAARNKVDELKDMQKIERMFSATVIALSYGDFGVAGIALSKELNGGSGVNYIARWESTTRSNNGKWTAGPRMNIVWRNSDSANYVYGVSSRDAKIGRPAYRLDESYRLIASYEITYEFQKNWQAVGGFEYAQYDSEISNSPIIEKDTSLGFWLGLRRGL